MVLDLSPLLKGALTFILRNHHAEVDTEHYVDVRKCLIQAERYQY